MNLLNIFEIIVSSSLIGSIIVFMILITKGIFRNKLNFTFKYYIWLILIIKLIIPFGPQNSLNSSDLYKNFYVQSTTNKIIQNTQINPSKELINSDLLDLKLVSEVHSSNNTVISDAVSVPINNVFNFEKTFYFIWILGVTLSLGVLGIGYKKLKNIVGASIKSINCKHSEILKNCMKDMHIRTEVELLYSKKISSPSLCGLFKPKILIPVKIAANICDEEFKYIILHELTHLKSKDIAINWAINLLSMIYWFNPILLYGFHKMRQDCEISCDGQVISYLGEGENIQYGNTIIKVLELGCNGNRIMGTTSMVLNRMEMKRRIIMISKYNKINIKSIILGAVIVFIIGGFGIAINTSSKSSYKNISNATTLQVETPVPSSNIANTSNAAAINIKKSSNDRAVPIVPFLADIVIYNSHPNETYSSGKKVTDVGALLNDKLVKEGFNSHFIKINQSTNYNKSFQIARTMITKNVELYSNTILIDIHCDSTLKSKSEGRKILFILTKENPRYEANKRFVDSLSGNFKKSNDVKSDILLYQYGISFYNQDLSDKASLIEIGNTTSSDSDIETCLSELVSALKNTEKISSN
jgi:bla regulator protein BlaR1